MQKQQAILMLGSQSDLEQAEKITTTLNEFGILNQIRIASAHRVPQTVQKIVNELEQSPDQIIIIAVVGLSNALSGLVAGISSLPVITCPIYNQEDIMSSLRMPPGVAHGTVLNPENAALYTTKIFSLSNPELKAKIHTYLQSKQKRLEEHDESIQRKSQKSR
ncbi:MAG: AIR carboxylase family protein [bacterium]